MIKALILIVLTFGSFAGAQTSLTPVAAPLLTLPSEAELLLTGDLLASVKTLDKEIRIYHYFFVPQIHQALTQASGRDAYVSRYFDIVYGRFWDLNFVTDQFINAGPGLYAAIDPSISKSFGNAVAEISLMPGTRFLNVVKPIKLREETLQALFNEGYFNSSSKEILFKLNGNYVFSRDTLKNVTTLAFSGFRKLIHSIFQTQQITAIEYNWDTDLSGFCRKHSYSAFVLIGGAENAKKIMSIPDLNLPNLTVEELDSQKRVFTYRRMLEDIQDKRKAGVKVDPEIKTYYFPNLFELNDLINKTYSCEN